MPVRSTISAYAVIFSVGTRPRQRRTIMVTLLHPRADMWPRSRSGSAGLVGQPRASEDVGIFNAGDVRLDAAALPVRSGPLVDRRPLGNEGAHLRRESDRRDVVRRAGRPGSEDANPAPTLQVVRQRL